MSDSTLPQPVDLFVRATSHAEAVMSRVTPAQLANPTPCRAWTVQDLIDHMVGGPAYLLSALAGQPPTPISGATLEQYRTGVAQAVAAVGEPGALSGTCLSPLNFEWTVEQAVAGTFMDQLIHTWDLATATDQDATLDQDLVAACTAMFLPDMPEMGRAGGLVGPAVAAPADASAQDQLLEAMGRHP